MIKPDCCPTMFKLGRLKKRTCLKRLVILAPHSGAKRFPIVAFGRRAERFITRLHASALWAWVLRASSLAAAVGVIASYAQAETSLITEGSAPGLLRIGPCEAKRVLHQKFDAGFVVSPRAVVGSSWIAHTPWNGDFGDAAFVDPRPGFPFTVKNGQLTIEARKVDRRWYSGLIASADGQAKGFAEQYGYFEVRAKLPQGKGLWPAIWLASAKPVSLRAPSIEIDVLEHYGQFPDKFNSVVHIWAAEGGEQARPGQSHIQDIEKGSLYDRFRSYGVDVEPDWITFYFDRREFWRFRTPPEHKYPLMMLIDLALGSGWPIDEAPSPSFMIVDYVDVYERHPGC